LPAYRRLQGRKNRPVGVRFRLKTLFLVGFFIKTLDRNGVSTYNYSIENEKGTMKYVLITKTGRVMCFYVKAVAELYQSLNGGVICCESVEVETV
jgi:hypothetical protein